MISGQVVLRFSFDSEYEDQSHSSHIAQKRKNTQPRHAKSVENDDDSKLKILIVDDESTIRLTLAEAVRAWGYRTIEAATVAETLTMVDREQPDAVLLDIKLPDGSGMTALDELRKKSTELVIIIITGYVTHRDAFEAGVRHANGYITKPIDQAQLRTMLNEALKGRVPASRKFIPQSERRRRPGEAKRGRPQHQTAAPLGNLILNAMKLLELGYKDIVSESERLANLHNNPDMRIGKSTLGNIISGSIRQPGTAKLDSLRIILNLSRAEVDAAIGLQPERRFVEELEMTRARTHEVSLDAVTRQRKIRIPILREDVDLKETQFVEGAFKRWANVEVEYLASFYPPYLAYVVVGEDDTNASPIAPPGSRLMVNKLLNKVTPAEGVSFHERELFYVLTPNGLTCVYLEIAAGDKIVLIPHPVSGNVREEFDRDEVEIIGQVVGVLYPTRF
ncbi:MAG TPA: response regulator [Pyrinomonadaceae bacterium]